MRVSNEEIFLNFVEERNLSQNSMNAYVSALRDYCKFHKMTLQKLYNEADKEEEENIRLKNRKVLSRLVKYRTYKINEGTGKNTIKNYFSCIKTFYKHNGIDLPYIPRVNLKDDFHERFDDIPTLEHIKEALENTKNTRHKAMILFMASSGTAINETLNITVGDFIKATADYHDNSTNLKDTLEKLKGQDDIVPIFEMTRLKTNHPYYTCCSPEATKMILSFLRKNDRFKKDDKLFNLSKKGATKAFADINDRQGWGFVGKRRFFHSHALRTFNATAIEDEKLGNTIQGRKEDSVTESYFKKNPKRIRERYKKHIDKLTVNKYYVNVVNTEGYEKLKAELDEKDEIIQKQTETITALEGGLKTVQEDVKKLKNPNKFYSPIDIINEISKQPREVTPYMMEIIKKRISEDNDELYNEGKDKIYVKELIDYASNTLKIKPNYFSNEEKTKIKTKNKVNKLRISFSVEATKSIYTYLIDKNIQLSNEQEKQFGMFCNYYIDEIFYYDDGKIDMNYVDSMIMKIINNEPMEIYISPNNTEKNKDQQYLKKIKT